MNKPQLNNKSIICFSGEDWWFHNPHSNLHIMQILARNNRVLFVNSMGIKMPDLNQTVFSGNEWVISCKAFCDI